MIRALTVLILTFTNASAIAEESLEIVTPAKTSRFSVRDLKAKLKPLTVEINDPVYKQKKIYDGFLLKDVFGLAGLKANATGDEVIFTAKDGYSPNMPFSALNGRTAYLVYAEHGKASGHFATFEQGKTKMTPAPFYVVWKDGVKTEHEVPWPYQLVKIEAVDFSAKYDKLFPKGAAPDSHEYAGFILFKSECIRCHSINLQGGDVGPELNAPKSVTEYWRADILPKFIKNSPGFRYKSKMPSFERFSDKQVEDLISYLRLMAKHKISKP